MQGYTSKNVEIGRHIFLLVTLCGLCLGASAKRLSNRAQLLKVSQSLDKGLSQSKIAKLVGSYEAKVLLQPDIQGSDCSLEHVCR